MPKIPKSEPASFAARTRELLRERGMTIAQLSEGAELEPSSVSRLLAENASTRREVRTEHVFAFARVLQVAPSDLVLGTDAESTLADWIPRAELLKEIDERLLAQKEASDARIAAASAEAEAATHRTQVDALSREVAQVNATITAERAAHAKSVRDCEAKLAGLGGQVATLRAQVVAERERGDKNYRAWAATNSALEAARRNASVAKGIAIVTGLLGFGAIASAASEDDDDEDA